MRLLKVEPDGTFSLIRVHGNKIPRYAILSHTWEADDQEVTFQDLADGSGERKAGYRKIRFCGKQANSDGIEYFWVDSCCIDKSSSAELAEAINSMFRWYRNADRCYVYLSDVPTADVDLQAFRHSRWFTRGWTLQELLAPRTVEFFSQEGQKIGDKQSLELQIHQVSGIPIRALQELGDLSQFSVKERMSWTARRENTIEEDQAYCLLGIFEVYLPLIYGEGKEHALGRLRAEITKRNTQDAPLITDALPAANSHACLTSLVPTDQTRFLSQALFRSKDGCAWIFQNQKYIFWHESKKSALLWIKAKAGHGKTTLAAHIYQKLIAHRTHEALLSHAAEPKRVVLYFFFQKTNDEAMRTAPAAFRTLVHQLVRQVPALLPYLVERHSSLSVRGKVEWSWDTLSAMLDEMLQQISYNSKIYIILDALDECELESRVLILDWAKELVNEHAASTTSQGLRTDLRILVTSRSDGDIIDHLSDYMYPTIEITAVDTASDIQALIKTRVERFARQRRLGSDVTQPILQFLESNAHGMFLWVVLIMQDLERRGERLTDDFIASKLSSIPLTLFETYISIIQNTPIARRQDMWSIYRWLLFGTRTLTLAELETAMCFETGVSTWHDFVGDLSFLCGSLIRVGGPQDEVSFVHQTARNFVETFPETADAAELGVLDMDSNAANDHLATICVRYLLLKEELFAELEPAQAIYESKKDNSDKNRWKVPVRDCLKRHKLLRYTVQSWATHAQAVCAPSSTLAVIIRTFLSSAMHRNGIMNFKLFPDEKFHFSDFGDGAEPLHVAAYFKILWLAQMYISEYRGSVHALSTWSETALNYASSIGSTECARILLEAGADPDHIGDGVICLTALQRAALKGHVDVSRLLLEHGASLDIGDNDNGTALHMSTFDGNVDIVTLLLNHGASLDIRDRDGKTALHLSAWSGHVDVVTLLLKHGASLDIQSSSGKTALHISASSGYVDIATLMLDHGASLDHRDRFGWTALDFAIHYENWNVVDVLVQWAENAGMDLKDLTEPESHKEWREHVEDSNYSKTSEDSSGDSRPRNFQSGHQRVARTPPRRPLKRKRNNYVSG